MRFVFSGQNKSLFNLLKTYVCEEGDTFSYFDDGLNLLKSILLDDVCVDFILLEQTVYKGFEEFLFNLLSSRSLKIPLVLVGECELGADERIAAWISENEIQYDLQTFHTLIPVFQKIYAALEKPEIKRLLENPAKNDLPVEGKLLIKKAKINPVDNFRNENSLSPAIYQLLKYLYKNRCREVSLLEIEKHMNIKGRSEKSRRNAVYAYISRLRKCFEGVPLCTMEVQRTRMGFYKLILR